MVFFTGIAAAIGLTGLAASTFVAVGTNLLIAAVGYVGSAIFKSLSGSDASSGYGVNAQLQSGGDVPRYVPFGLFCTAGSYAYGGSWGEADKTQNAYLVQVIALTDLPVKGLSRVFVGNDPVTLLTGSPTSMGYPVSQYRVDGVDYLWVKFYDGTQTVADSYLVSKFGSSDHPYDSGRVGYGCGYAIVTSRLNNELFSGVPKLKFEINGMKLYDISKDDTAGGSGTQRYGTPSTWGGDGDDLVGVQIYNLMRGLTYGGKWFYGLQNLPSVRLPAADWVASVNKCRQVFAGPNGNEAQYRAGSEFPVSSKIAEAIEALLTASQGRMPGIGGTYTLRVGAATAATATFTDDVIISTEEQQFTPFFTLDQTVNGITAKYPSPAEGWNTKVAPPLYDSDLEALDGNRRLLTDISIDVVPYPGQIQRIMKAALAEARRERRHTLVLPPEFQVLVPGDYVSWTSDRNGYASKLFRVDGTIDQANLDVMVDLTEVNPADYDWNQGTDYRTPVDGPVVIIRPPPQPIVDWDAQPYALDDNTGTARRPAILLTWDGDQDDVIEVEWIVRLFSTFEQVTKGSTYRVSAGGAIVSAGLIPNTHYQVQGRYVPESGRKTLWSDWIDVTTPNVLIGSDDVYDGVWDWSKFADEVNFQAEENAADVRELWEELNRMQIVTSDIDLRHFDNIQTLDRVLTSKLGIASASFSEQILVATGPDSALAQQLTTLESSLDGYVSSSSTAIQQLQTKTTQQGDQISSQATSLTTLTSRVGTTESQISGQGTAISGLQTKTTQQGDQISSTSSALTTLTTRVQNAETGLSGQSSAISGLQTTTSQHGGTLSTQASQISGLQSSVNGINGTVAGQATAISGLTTRVTNAEGKATAQATLINNLSATVDDRTADALFKMTVSSDPPSGYNTRIVMQGKYTAAGVFRSAGLFIDVNASTARISLRADQFVVTNAAGTIKRPFLIQNNSDGVQTVFMDQVEINGAKITDLSVDTLQVANNAISGQNANTPAGIVGVTRWTNEGGTDQGWYTAAETSITVAAQPNGAALGKVLLQWGWTAELGGSGGPSSNNTRINMRLLKNDVEQTGFSDTFLKPQGGEYNYFFGGLDSSPVVGVNKWTLQLVRYTNNDDYFEFRRRSMILTYLKK